MSILGLLLLFPALDMVMTFPSQLHALPPIDDPWRRNEDPFDLPPLQEDEKKYPKYDREDLFEDIFETDAGWEDVLQKAQPYDPSFLEYEEWPW